MNVNAYALFAKGTTRTGDFVIAAAGELAWVRGDTTLGRNNAFPNSELKVQQLGWLARLSS
ncbi:MAG: hypothetical protein AAB295_12140, partial [Chloroflexota bacterium]